MREHVLARAWRRLRKRGPAGVVEALGDHIHRWREARFDRRLGIETRAGGGGAGYGYQPIQPEVFGAVLRCLALEPREWGFVDFGAGKGRALILASRERFARVTGVEIDPLLAATARDNAARHHARDPGATAVEVIEGDAATFDPPPGRAVLFFYNPFDAAVMAAVLDHLEPQARAANTEWLLVYRTAIHAAAVRARPWLVPLVERPDFTIWATRR